MARSRLVIAKSLPFRRVPILSHSAGDGRNRGVMPRQLTIFFPDGQTEYWLTTRVFGVGDTFSRGGVAWIVTSITAPDGQRSDVSDEDGRHATITLRLDCDGDRRQPDVRGAADHGGMDDEHSHSLGTVP